MIDKFLPTYLLDTTTITTSNGSRTSTIASGTNNNVWRDRVPEGTPFPYITVSSQDDVDFGQVAGPSEMGRELSLYVVSICGRTFASIDQIYYDVVDLLKMVRQQYLPNQSAASKVWTQCIILKNSTQFDIRPIDGDQKPMLGYDITILAAYDPRR